MCATCGCSVEGAIDDSMTEHDQTDGEGRPHDQERSQGVEDPHEHSPAPSHPHVPAVDTSHRHVPAVLRESTPPHDYLHAFRADQRSDAALERRRMPPASYSLARPRPTEQSDRERIVMLEQQVLAKNSYLADQNRQWFEERKVLALNILSSPGAGKTTLLESTIRALRTELTLSVIEGDQETSLDAARIAATGSPAIQVNTGSGCHLDAAMISRCLPSLAPPRKSIVLIENVGNLVCPALYDLGERSKVVIISTTEGDDKPLKYPNVFRASELLL
ncbi:MAG: hydrogenase nickel incorporation protein HypB, partial [Myxococcaceae bacterium]